LSILQTLVRVFMPRTKINPAGEGKPHAGPYHIIGQGWLPDAWGKYLNFWQMDYDPLPYPSCSIVEACVWAYIRAIAQLPGYHKRELDNGGTEIVNTSALSRLLRTPNGYSTPSDFLVHLVRSLLLNGNSYWIAQRNERSEVEALHWTDPRHCQVREIAVNGQAAREIFYEISDNPLLDLGGLLDRRSLVVPARDVLHVKLATPRHPLIGETWLAALAVELGNRAAIEHSLGMAAANARPAGVLHTDLQLTTAQVAELKERWNQQAAGLSSGGVPILTYGLKFQPISMSAEDAQTIEQLKLTDRMVAAVFGVPAILLGISDTATQKSAEAVMAEWLASGLGWLINHIEVAFDHFIGLNEVPAGREWTEFDTRALLRSLFKERIEGLVRGVQGGVYAPNEARAAEGMPAKKGGDEPRVQQQLVPLSFAGTVPPAPAVAPADDDDDDEAEGDDDEAEAGAKAAATAYRIRKLMDAIPHERAA
jgi:HK97 family phage portal protein